MLVGRLFWRWVWVWNEFGLCEGLFYVELLEMRV